MAIDWGSVAKQVDAAVGGILGKDWGTAYSGASAQIAALVQIGQSIELNDARMSADDYKSLQLMEQRAIEGVLQTYQSITIIAAEQAAAAAWNVVAQALKAACGFPFIP